MMGDVCPEALNLIQVYSGLIHPGCEGMTFVETKILNLRIVERAGQTVFSAAIETAPVPEQTIQRRPIMTRALMIADSILPWEGFISRFAHVSARGWRNRNMRSR
jgi:hypothetical protein